MKTVFKSVLALAVIGVAMSVSSTAFADFSVSVNLGYNQPYSTRYTGYPVNVYNSRYKATNPSYYQGNRPQVIQGHHPTIIIINPQQPLVRSIRDYCYATNVNRVRAPGWNDACSRR